MGNKAGNGCHEGLVGSLSSRFEEWVGWDSAAAPVLENGEWAGKSREGRWFYSCLKWDCSEHSTWIPRKSGAVRASLGWLSFHWPESRNAPKPSCLPDSVQLTGVGVVGVARLKQSVFLCLRVSLMGLRAVGNLGELSSGVQQLECGLYLCLKRWIFYCGWTFCHVNAQIPCLLVPTPQCVPQLQCLCWIINILL